MSHHGPKFTQGLNMPALALVAVVGTICVWVTVVGVQAFYDAGVRAEEQKKIVEPDYLAQNPRTAALLADQQAHLAHIDAGKRAVIARFGRPDNAPKPSGTSSHTASDAAHGNPAAAHH